MHTSPHNSRSDYAVFPVVTDPTLILAFSTLILLLLLSTVTVSFRTSLSLLTAVELVFVELDTLEKEVYSETVSPTFRKTGYETTF